MQDLPENILDERIAFVRRTKSDRQGIWSGSSKRMWVEPWKSCGHASSIRAEQRKSTCRKPDDPHPIKINANSGWVIGKYRPGKPHALYPLPGPAQRQRVPFRRGGQPCWGTGCLNWRWLDRRCRRVRRLIAWTPQDQETFAFRLGKQVAERRSIRPHVKQHWRLQRGLWNGKVGWEVASREHLPRTIE